MIVTLTPESEALVRKLIERGPYADPDEVVHAALRLVQKRDKLARLRAAIAVGDEQIARGEVVEWTPDFMDRLMAEAAEADRLGLPIKDEVKP